MHTSGVHQYSTKAITSTAGYAKTLTACLHEDPDESFSNIDRKQADYWILMSTMEGIAGCVTVINRVCVWRNPFLIEVRRAACGKHGIVSSG